MVKLGYLNSGDSFKIESIVDGKFSYYTINGEKMGNKIRIYSHGSGYYIFVNQNRMVEKIDKIPKDDVKKSNALYRKRIKANGGVEKL